MVDQEVLTRIEALEEQGVQRDREIADLSGRLSRLAATLEAMRVEAPGAIVPAAAPPPLKSEVSSAAASRSPASTSTSPPAVALPPPPAPAPASAPFASLIVADFPALFAEFRGKRFTLLWRGSRDGFRARDFHGCCDGHANTLTFIEDTEGNIFGGFTPVEWESREYDRGVSRALRRSNLYKADPSLKSFLFTLKNPHNFPARKFALRAEKKDEAIYCLSACGPHFYDISVSDSCNANVASATTLFGLSYADDTGLDRGTFFTGSMFFTVKEIEIFEITD